MLNKPHINFKNRLHIIITMTTEPQCRQCHYHIKTEDRELLCVKRDSSFFGKIIGPKNKCDLFSDYMVPDPEAKKILEDTNKTNDISLAVIMLRESRKTLNSPD